MASSRSSRPTPDTVLLIEQAVELRYAIAKFLTEQGFHVIAASDGPDALTVAKGPRSRIDLIVIDRQMPHRGPSLAQLLQQARPKAFVLYISGSAPTEAQPPVVVLSKPYQFDELLSRMRE